MIRRFLAALVCVVTLSVPSWATAIFTGQSDGCAFNCTAFGYTVGQPLPEVKLTFHNLMPGQVVTTADLLSFDVRAGNGLLLDQTSAQGEMFWGLLNNRADAFTNFILVVAMQVSTDPTQFGKMIVYMPGLWIDGNGECDTSACTHSTLASLDAFSSGRPNLLTGSGGMVPEPGTIFLLASLLALPLFGAARRRLVRIFHR